MTNTSGHESGTDYDHDAMVVTDEIHENSWSVNLEKPRYEDNAELVTQDGINAVAHTAPGYHVNLVTHASLGHPEEFLFKALEEYDEQNIEWEYIEQCGCGGYVTRVHVE